MKVEFLAEIEDLKGVTFFTAQILIAVAFLFTIQILSAIGVKTVNIISTNCLTMNCIFSFINRYMNIAITIAVVIAFPRTNRCHHAFTK